MKVSTRTIAVTGLLLALTIILGLTPLGFIPVPPAGATIMAIPLLIGLFAEGWGVGGIIALGFGLFSMYQAYTSPVSPISFVFMNPLVAVLPRLCIVPAAYFARKGASLLLKGKGDKAAVAIGSVAGSLMNTVGVLAMIYICYASAFADAMGIPGEGVIAALGGIALSNGIWEAALSALITTAVITALSRMYAGNKIKR